MGVRSETIDTDAVLFHGDRYDSTSLALFDGDRALLIEGLGSVADAEALRAELAARGKRVEFLVSTHYFSDHLAAWNLFPKAVRVGRGSQPLDQERAAAVEEGQRGRVVSVSEKKDCVRVDGL